MSTEAAAERAWREILALAAAGDGAERALVERLLEEWRRESGHASAGLYLPNGNGWRLEAVAGAGGLVPDLEAGEEPHAAPRLGPALLLTESGAASEAAAPLESPLASLLAVAARGLALRQQLKVQGFEARYRGVELEALYDVGLAIASTLDFDRLCEEVLMRAVSLLDARRGALYLVDGPMLRLNRAFGGDALAGLPLTDPGVARLLAQESDDAASRLLRGTPHLLAVPMPVDGDPTGILVVADKETRRGVGPFRDADRRTLGLLANQAAIALENANLHRQALEKERLEREIELASDIQRRILPKSVPEVPGFALAGWNRPARHIGGDYFDFLTLASGRLGIALGDVSGKGVPAALLVSTLHSSLRLLVDRIEVGPDLFARLNQHILDSSAPNRFITLILAELDPMTGRLCYVNAGHNPGLLLRADGEVEQLPAGGLPIGLMPGSRFLTQQVHLAPGDLLCLYSDGITEAATASDEEFGLDRLGALLEARRDEPLDAIVEAIDREVLDFTGGAAQGDDQTLVLMRRER